MFDSSVTAVLGSIPDHELDDALGADLIAAGTDTQRDRALHRWAQEPAPRQCYEPLRDDPVTDDPGEPLDPTASPGPRLAATLSGLIHETPDAAALAESGLADGELVEFVAAAERLSRWAQWLRGTAVLALSTRWTTTDPTNPTDLTDVADPSDLPGEAGVSERARRLAGVERRERRHSPLAYGPGDAELAEAFAVSETALVAGISETMTRQWLHIAAALAHHLPICSDALRTGRLDWSKVRAVTELTDGRTAAIARAAEALVLPDALLPEPEPAPRYPGDHSDGPTIRTVPDLKNRVRAALLLLDAAGEADAAAREHDTRRVTCRAISPTMGELLATLPLDQVARIAARLDEAVVEARHERDPRTADQVRADTLTDLLTHGLVPGPRTGTADDADDLDEGRATGSESGAAQSTGDPTTDSSSHTSCGDAVPRPTSTHVLVTITLETLLGLRDDPGRLDHYGPIAADLARDLAADGIWRCAAVDDTHHTVLGLGRSTYTPRYSPGQRLIRLLHATCPCCTFPGCRTRARHCDLDHAQPWPAGRTCSCNVHPLCRRHHRMKTHGQIELQPSRNPDHPPGTWLWRLPTGRTYTSRPEPPLPLVRPGPRQAPACQAPARAGPEPPPPF